MPGYNPLFPRRIVVDEVITTGTVQPTGVSGWTGLGAVARYNSWATPLPPSTSARVIAVTNASTSASTTVTTGITNPDYPRAVRIAASTSANIAGNVTINGTNQFGATIQDLINPGASGIADGVLAFKTITSIVLPAVSSGATPVTIGLSNIFGLDRTPGSVAACIRGSVNGIAETTAPIVGPASTSSATAPALASRATAKFSTAATSSAGALVDILFVPQDVVHI